MFYGYIKDCNNITDKPKAFVRISNNGVSTIKKDLLTSVKSTFNVATIPNIINVGDILIVYDEKGVEYYVGKIVSYGDNKITCTQIQDILNGVWLCKNYESTTIEDEIKQAVEGLISGRIGDLTDNYIANKYANFSVIAESQTTGNLPTFEEKQIMDFDKFIYQMYEDYGIIVDVKIPYEGNCLITIKKPNYGSFLISDNTRVINQITPTTEVEQNNKLVIFASDGTYRATYVVSADATPVIAKLDDTDVLNRFLETKTKIVYSDDPLDTIVNANLTTEMYNHKITFEILLKNKIYNWDNFKLGQPLEIWNGTDYFNTILTGYEMTLQANAKPNSVKLICGKVRTALTDKLKRLQ